VAVRREELLLPDLLQEVISLKKCRHGLVGPAHGERDVLLGQERENQFEGLGARRVDVRHRLRVQHEPADRRGGIAHQPLDLLGKDIGVGEVERSAESVNDEARVVGLGANLAGDEVAPVRRLPERPGPGSRCAADDVDDRQEDGDDDALESPQDQHAEQAGDGDPEIGPPHPPQLTKLLHLDEGQDGVRHDARQRCRGQIGQQVGEEEHHEYDGARCDETRQLRLRACAVHRSRPRRTVAHHDRAREAGGHAGGAVREHLLVAVGLVAVLSRVLTHEQEALAQGDRHDGQGAGQHLEVGGQGDGGDVERGNGRRHLAEHGHSQLVELQHRGEGRQDHQRDERAGNPWRVALDEAEDDDGA